MATVSEGTANPLVIIPQSHFLGRYSWIHRDVYIYIMRYINDTTTWLKVIPGSPKTALVTRITRITSRVSRVSHVSSGIPQRHRIMSCGTFLNRYSDTGAATCGETHFEGLFSLFQAVVLVSVAIQGMKAT